MPGINLKRQQGLTLIEILISLSIFSIVITIIGNITFDTLRAEAVAASNQVALDNARFILQRIAKSLRVSVIKTPGNNLDSDIIKMEHPRRGTVEYFLSGNRIVERLGEDSTTDSFLDSSNVDIEKFIFNIKGADNGSDSRQPQISIILQVKPPNARQEELPPINIQTTLSQRCLDIFSSCKAI